MTEAARVTVVLYLPFHGEKSLVITEHFLVVPSQQSQFCTSNATS